jgi:hypothetical protein
MKIAAASVINASPYAASTWPVPAEIWNRIRKTIAFFRKLSLKAEKN